MGGQNISWGKMIAGAAVAVGAVAAVAFCPGLEAFTAVIHAHPAIFVGATAVVGALIGALTGQPNSMQSESAALENESFAMREDMRRMQALMQARMAATGYQPAMAFAGQRR